MNKVFSDYTPLVLLLGLALDATLRDWQFLNWAYCLTLLIIVALGIIFFGLMRWIVKDSSKAAVILTVILGYFLYYGIFLALARNFLPLLSRNRVFIPVSLLVVATICLLVFRLREVPARRVSLLLTGILVSLMLYSMALAVFPYLKPAASVEVVDRPVQQPKRTLTDTIRIPLDYIPDIIYILADAYTSSQSLARYWKYNNGPFEESLTRMGFVVTRNSQSFYPSTVISMASTLNGLADRSLVGPHDWRGAFRLVNEARMVTEFEKRGYSFVNRSFFLVHAQLPIYSVLDDDLAVSAVPETVEVWLNRILGRSFYHSVDLLHQVIIAERKMLGLLTEIGNLKYRPDRPSLYYYHLLVPHQPFWLAKDGSVLPGLSADVSPSEYLNQLMGVNIHLEEAIGSLLRNYPENRQPIVILQGDHGYRFLPASYQAPEESYTILNAYHFPVGGNANLYDTISPYNTFGMILNTYFDGDIPYQPDGRAKD